MFDQKTGNISHRGNVRCTTEEGQEEGAPERLLNRVESLSDTGGDALDKTNSR